MPRLSGVVPGPGPDARNQGQGQGPVCEAEKHSRLDETGATVGIDCPSKGNLVSAIFTAGVPDIMDVDKSIVTRRISNGDQFTLFWRDNPSVR
jgi:hypothetical protein